MHFFFSVLFFLFILFFYIHLQYQYKTSDDLEIYELDYTTNTQLQEICHLKQPVLFQLDQFKELEPFFKTISLQNGREKEDINVKDIRDYYKPDITSVDAISLSFSSAYGLMETDTKGYFFSENNHDFVREKGKCDFSKVDDYLASPWILHKQYDLLFGSKHSHTPLKYHTETGRFLIVSSSPSPTSPSSPSYICIKMTPWKNRKSLYVKKDYENYEFWSPIDIWHNPPDKMKCLEFNIYEGFALYIPPYWFYSIEFPNPTISVACFTYSTGMNIFSNLSNIGLYFLQQNNIKNLGNWKNIKNVISSSSSSTSTSTSTPSLLRENIDTEEKKEEKEVQEILSVITKPTTK